MYPIGIHRTCSPLSSSSLSLTLSHNSTDSNLTADSSTPLDQKILSALRLIVQPERREVPVAEIIRQPSASPTEEGGIRRRNWITNTSDKVYVQFKHECWGVPVYDDIQLFELLAMSGMLMDFNWTEILKRREFLRDSFAGFDPKNVSKMGEKEILEIAFNEELTLAESRVRCIVDNAKCVTKIGREFGSFSSYIWDCVNYKPVINKFKYPRNVPLRSPKAESMSKDLLKHRVPFSGARYRVFVHASIRNDN